MNLSVSTRCCKAKSVPQNKNPKEPPALRFSRPTASQNEFWHLGTGFPPSLVTGVHQLRGRYQAAFDGDVARLADLLEDEDVDVCCRDHNLQTPLMLAALGGSLECVEYLVDARADVAAVDRQKDTAFDVAIAEHSDRFPDHPVLLYFQSARPQA
ncbi:unnamed protein product [Effrenium voratum]|nr:unnamed protein product [Effrenium voratum]